MNINENFMLVCCIKQDIQSIILFDVFEQAFDKMCEQFGDVWNMTVKDVKEKYCNIHEDEYNCDNSFIGNYFAFTERYGNNYNWKIFSVSDLIKEKGF